MFNLTDEQTVKWNCIKEQLGRDALSRIAYVRGVGRIIPFKSLSFGEAIDYLFNQLEKGSDIV
jgi:hypothetical protein